MPDHLCRQRLWLTRETVHHLCQMITHLTPCGYGSGYPVLVAVKMTAVLNLYVSGSFQGPSGDLSGISQTSVHKWICTVTGALCAWAADYVNFNMDQPHQDARAAKFAVIADMPQVQGVIDGTQVPRAPAHQGVPFINQKGFHSLSVKLVCDHQLHIMHQYPGDVHNVYILDHPLVPGTFEVLPRMRGLFLGDNCYLLRSWLMIPVRRPQTDVVNYYNDTHAATRSVIGRCIDALKML
ncbi:putative nuclease HARBI1 [Scyliorhinus torazame]|uniref:putative nuclease HARBI1 n=1 Tax=Scyliorhinus torazame TaxID=75743 RepID=UPI003B5BBBD0